MKLSRLFRTSRQFQPVQIRHKIVYELKKARAQNGKFKLASKPPDLIVPIPHSESIPHRTVYSEGAFTFLNRTKYFGDEPDWNFNLYGSLWNTCLNSFEYLDQHGLDVSLVENWMKSYIRNLRTNRRAYDSHCVSKRLIHWLPFISKNQLVDPQIYSFLNRQAEYLFSNPELHLRNSHLLENGFALLHAGIFFRDKKFFNRAEKLLIQHLPGQILSDGAHVELSPMYHSVILSRMLRSIDMLRKVGDHRISPLIGLLSEQACMMSGWLRSIIFENGELPHLNDSASDLTPPWPALFQMANQLGLKCIQKPLGESGFRKFQNRHFELIADVNGLVPIYAPGHAHADTSHFILQVFGSPFIVDTGVSTYEAGTDRDYERSTRAHNTVVINGQSQSELSGTFRVGRKAKVTILEDKRCSLRVSHDGYKPHGAMHTRTFQFEERDIHIRDLVQSSGKPSCSAFLHIDKKNGLKIDGKTLHSKFVRIDFDGAHHIAVSEKWMAPAFGVKLPAWEVKIDFDQELMTKISLP